MPNMEIIKEKFEKFKDESEEIQQAIRERTLSYITAALGLVAGLAWNEAIKALIEYLFPLSQNTLFAKFLYAILITAVIIILTIYLTKLFKKREK